MILERWIRRASASLAGVAVLTASAAGFTVGSVSGDAQAKQSDGTYAPAKTGDTCASGTELRTGTDGRLTAQFDARNGVVVQPETTVRVSGTSAAGGSGVRLALSAGRVQSVLAAWPAGTPYDVVSAVGTFRAHGTTFTTGYTLGTGGEFVGDAAVEAGEIEFQAPEFTVPSLAASGGATITRTVGLESVLIEITANGNPLTVVIGGRHRVTVAAGATVRIAVALRYVTSFAAVSVLNGVATVGERTLTPADGAVFFAGTQVFPNAGAQAFMEAVRVESSANAQLQLPGLTAEQIAALRATQRSGARAVLDSAVGSGMAPTYQSPFVPERPLSAPLSPSGTP